MVTVFRDERLHPLQVVLDAVGVQHGGRQAHVLVEQIPFETPRVAKLDARARNHAEALAERVDRRTLIVCNFHSLLLHRPFK